MKKTENRMDEFEQKLQRQPLRQIPADWREDILSASRAAAVSRRSSCNARLSLLSTLNSQLSSLLWPSPKAWAGLAAVWVVIFALNFSIRDSTHTVVKQTSPPSPELIMVVKEQRRELARLIEPSAPNDADKPKSFVPRPRSEREDGFQII